MSRFVDTDLTFIGLSNSNGELKTKDAPPLIPPVVSQAAINWLRTRMGWAAALVGEQTARQLAEAIAVGFEAGEGIPDIADRVAAVFDMTVARSERIARTEVIAASAQGAVEGYRASGAVDRTEWYTALDERVCDICYELHGQVNSLGEGYTPPAHPDCLLPNVRVEAAHVVAGSRAFYRGDAVEITTENGHVLSVTPNHMVLTPAGFVAVQSLRQGDYVVSSRDGQRITSSIDPYNDHRPTPVEDIWDALMVKHGVLVDSMPVAPVDFHGDARSFDGNVDVIWSDSFLRNGMQFVQPLKEKPFGFRLANTSRLAGLSPQGAFCKGLIPIAGSNVRGSGAGLALCERHVPHRNNVCLTTVARDNPGSNYSAPNYIAAYAHVSRQFQLRFARLVTVEKITKVCNFNFAGYVYDLQTKEHWYIANSIVTHNCRCVLLPILKGETPEEPEPGAFA